MVLVIIFMTGVVFRFFQDIILGRPLGISVRCQTEVPARGRPHYFSDPLPDSAPSGTEAALLGDALMRTFARKLTISEETLKAWLAGAASSWGKPHPQEESSR